MLSLAPHPTFIFALPSCLLYLPTQVVSQSAAEAAQRSANVWSTVPLRAWYRGQYGVALTLYRMGRYEEAQLAWRKLRKLDAGWYGTDKSYVNVSALEPDCILRCV